MARYLDEEAEREFIDVSSTSDGQGAVGGAVGGAPGEGSLPSPPHQPAVEVRMAPRDPGKPRKPQPSAVTSLMILYNFSQVQLDRHIDDAPILENIEQLLGLRIDPTDLRTCAFGE